VQRLFSTFPEGWPGAGLAFLRAVTAIQPIQHGIAGLWPVSQPLVMVHLVATGGAALLLAGLWTPVAGVLLAMVELGLGPGAWSLDARLFGRKRIQIRQR
jgi:uncharacterized membrane protein YphA (DoxX/SURF4 family)